MKMKIWQAIAFILPAIGIVASTMWGTYWHNEARQSQGVAQNMRARATQAEEQIARAIDQTRRAVASGEKALWACEAQEGSKSSEAGGE